jgi:predicted Rossmann fold flavoprotein
MHDNMTDLWDIAIIGAGAAGLAAAIFAADTARAHERALCIVALDSAKKLGAKILVSGGGRCNVTHEEVRPEDYHGARTIIRNVLAAFDVQATIRWFASLGVSLKREETGKLFPVSDSARTVLEALLQHGTSLGVTFRAQHRVQEILPCVSEQTPLFLVRHEQGELHARRIIMATGGRSLPRTGSDGSGWRLVQQLGHTVTPTYPALVPLVLRADMFHAEVSGIALPVELSTFANGKLCDRRTGNLLWTHFGVSGPVVMDASRHWVIAQASGQTAELRGNFFPGHSFDEIEKQLLALANARPRLSVGKAWGDGFPDRFALAILRWMGVDPATPLGQLSRTQRRTLVQALSNFLLPIEHERGWNFAEVTAGGVPLHEIDYRTMASRKAPGLYLTGEMLDCDGRIGGFNFQWAWATGYLAGRAAAQA